MRIGTVIGRVTLSVRHPAFRGERLLLTLPWTAAALAAGGASGHGPSVVVYDTLGAGPGQVITFSEGAEAARPFDPPAPVDALCTALVDTVFHQAAPPA